MYSRLPSDSVAEVSPELLVLSAGMTCVGTLCFFNFCFVLRFILDFVYARKQASACMCTQSLWRPEEGVGPLELEFRWL